MEDDTAEFSPEVKPPAKHERPDAVPASATLDELPALGDVPRPAEVAQATPAPSSSSHDTGVRRTMDALLALDSLTAAISSKPANPPHGYSHSALSDTSLSPPPSFSRLPPDGHEFPPNYQEPNHFSVGVPAMIEMNMALEKNEPNLKAQLDAPLSPPPPLPSSGPPQRKQSIGQEVEFVSSPSRKFSTSSTSSSIEEVTLRTPVRNPPWRKDEKSERSVRDKIAMFSTSQEGQALPAPHQPRRLSKYNSSEDVFSQEDVVDNSSVSLSPGKLLSRSVLSVDKVGQSPLPSRLPSDSTINPVPPASLYKKTSSLYSSTSDVSVASAPGVETNGVPSRSLDYTTRTQSYMDLPSSSSSAYSSCSPDSSLSSTTSTYTMGYSSTLPRKITNNKSTAPATIFSNDNNQKQNGGSTLYRRTSFCGSTGSNLHSRSQSLVDIGAMPSNKRNSIAGYNADDMRKASLNALIEQRRRGMSKLRGLVIPEKVTEVTTTNQAIIDLPEIKSRDSILTSKPQALAKDDLRSSHNRHSTGTNRWGTTTSTLADKNLSNINSSAAANLSSLPWKSQAPVANLPKYSPAFKRKSLSVYGLSSSASSVSSSLSSSREELRPLFDNPSNGNGQKTYVPPLPPMKPPRNPTSVANSVVKPSLTPSYSTTVTTPLLSHLEPPKSLESITSPTRSDLSFEFLSSNGSSPDLRITMPTHAKEDLVLSNNTKKNNEKILNGELYMKSTKGTTIHSGKGMLSSDIGRSGGEDDSDNDSAVSSSRSSISHGFSPPPSPLPDSAQQRDDHHHSSRQHLMLSPLPTSGNVPDKRPLRRTLSSETTASVASSTASTLTSGSQASCSSNGSSGSDSNKRVLKAQSVEAINRKNVLSSARYSSGRDLKVGSPLIQRKFEEDARENNESEIVDTRVEMLQHRKSDRYDSDEVKNNKHIFHNDMSKSNVELGRPREAMHYRTSSDSMSDGVMKMAYLEVEESDNTELVSDILDNYSGSQKGDATIGMDFMGTEDELEDEPDSPPPRPVAPLPAPRRTIGPLQAVKTATGTDEWTESEKYSSPVSTPDKPIENDEVFEYEKQSGDVDKNQMESDEDLSANSHVEQNNTDPVETNTNIASKWQVHSNGDAVSNNSTTNMSQAPNVPPKPKPVQRKSSLKNNNMQTENCNEITDDNSQEENNLMNILTGKSGAKDHAGIRLRDRQKGNDVESTNRPVSLSVEKNLEADEVVFNGKIKMSSSGEHPISPTNAGPNSRMPSIVSRHINNRRSVSVNDIKKAFEKAELALATSGRASNGSGVRIAANGIPNHHIRVSSLDSTTSEDSCVPPLTHYGSASNLHREQYGSITSLASSSTSLISQQELQTLIDEANQSIEESGGFCTPVHEVEVVILHRETIGGSVGITLAGGADYEAKEITVHKVLAGSLADRDGRIQKGDRILSINGRSMKGATHKESLNILKAPRLEVVLVMSRSRGDGSTASEELPVSNTRSSLSSSRPPRILEQLTETGVDCQTEDSEDNVARGPPVTITLAKDGAGLGFSLEGGKDSPIGDKPLTIKKIFTGGSAEKNGQLKAGDELLVVNGKDVTVMSRIEAWGLMKKLPDGNVKLTVRHRVDGKC